MEFIAQYTPSLGQGFPKYLLNQSARNEGERKMHVTNKNSLIHRKNYLPILECGSFKKHSNVAFVNV